MKLTVQLQVGCLCKEHTRFQNYCGGGKGTSQSFHIDYICAVHYGTFR